MRNHVFANNLKEGLLKLMALAWKSSQTWWQTTNHHQSLATSSLSFPRPSPHGNDKMKLRILIFLDLVSWHCLQDQLPAYVSPNLEGFHVPTLPSYGHDLQEEFHISDLWGHGVDNQRNDAGHIEEDPNTCCVRVRNDWKFTRVLLVFLFFFWSGTWR